MNKFFLLVLILFFLNYIQCQEETQEEPTDIKCDENCAECNDDQTCNKCHDDLSREVNDSGKCVCESGYFENNKMVCESKNNSGTPLYIVLCIVATMITCFVFNKLPSVNPLNICIILPLKHQKIKIKKFEQIQDQKQQANDIEMQQKNQQDEEQNQDDLKSQQHHMTQNNLLSNPHDVSNISGLNNITAQNEDQSQQIPDQTPVADSQQNDSFGNDIEISDKEDSDGEQEVDIEEIEKQKAQQQQSDNTEVIVDNDDKQSVQQEEEEKIQPDFYQPADQENKNKIKMTSFLEAKRLVQERKKRMASQQQQTQQTTQHQVQGTIYGNSNNIPTNTITGGFQLEQRIFDDMDKDPNLKKQIVNDDNDNNNQTQELKVEKCNQHCETCSQDEEDSCEKCLPDLNRELKEKQCVCKKGYFENNLFYCESEEDNGFIFYLFLCIISGVICCAVYNCMGKYNPLNICGLCPLFHQKIEFQKIKKQKEDEPKNQQDQEQDVVKVEDVEDQKSVQQEIEQSIIKTDNNIQVSTPEIKQDQIQSSQNIQSSSQLQQQQQQDPEYIHPDIYLGQNKKNYMTYNEQKQAIQKQKQILQSQQRESQDSQQ